MHKKLIALISATILISSSLIGCVGNKSNSNKVINVFNCGDYIDEELITKFEEETGYKLNILHMILTKSCTLKLNQEAISMI